MSVSRGATASARPGQVPDAMIETRSPETVATAPRRGAMRQEEARDLEGTRSVTLDGARRSVLGLVWAGGLLFVPVVALAATLHLAAAFGPTLQGLWASFPETGRHWLWAGLGFLVIAGAGLIAILRLVRGSREGWLLPLGLALVVVARIAAIVLVHPPLVSDWLKYYNLAQSVASSGPRFADVPTGYSILAAIFFKLFGANVLVGELINLAASILMGWLVYRLATQAWGRRAGGLALYLYAVSIAQVLMVTLFCTEVLFAAGLLAAMAIMLRATKKPGRAGILTALGCGALLGLSQYVRTDAELLLPAFLVLPFLAKLPARTAATLAVACLVSFLVILGPVVAWNRTTYGTWSVSTSNFGGWSLLVGTDPQSNGQWNEADLALLPADTTSRAFNDEAMSLALDRLREHPSRLPELAIRKIIPMWGIEDYAAVWTLDSNDPSLADERLAISLTSQVMYTGIALLAALCLWRERRTRPELLTLIILVVGATAVAHTFVEVQPRYHFYVEPLLCVLAGGWLATRIGHDNSTPTADSAPSLLQAQ